MSTRPFEFIELPPARSQEKPRRSGLTMMIDWGIKSALLAAGSSTHLAFGEFGWDIEMAGETDHRTLPLKESALSASGTGIQGSHILAPDGMERPYTCTRAWVMNPSAAAADAWSTAVMLMHPDDFMEQIPPEVIYLAEIDGKFTGNFQAVP